jgi:hypothetical protein
MWNLNIKFIILLTVLFSGCFGKKDPAKPVENPQSENTSLPKKAKTITSVPQTQTTTLKPDSLKPPTQTTQPPKLQENPKLSIYKALENGVFETALPDSLSSYYKTTKNLQKKELVRKLLSHTSLSRKHLGIKPWNLSEWLLTQKFDAKEDLFWLEFFPNAPHQGKISLRNYLCTKYNKNLGSNYNLWKRILAQKIKN